MNHSSGTSVTKHMRYALGELFKNAARAVAAVQKDPVEAAPSEQLVLDGREERRSHLLRAREVDHVAAALLHRPRGGRREQALQRPRRRSSSTTGRVLRETTWGSAAALLW